MKVQLYHRWECPYSARVRQFIHELRIDNIEMIEVGEVPQAADQLVYLTGYTQFPCLVIEGRPLLESADIIAWIQRHLATVDWESVGPWALANRRFAQAGR